MIGWLRNAFQIERDWIFKAMESFQRQKDHFKEKEVADMGVITKAFQTVKESLGIRRPSREVAEMCLIKRASIKEAGDWKDESFNKEVEMMRERKRKK